MGSYMDAVHIGFTCRLCSESKSTVIHIYSTQAKKLKLPLKLKFLPIKVEKFDKLPKTVCEQCIKDLDLQFSLVRSARRSDVAHRSHQMFHSHGKCPVECPFYRTVNF